MTADVRRVDHAERGMQHVPALAVLQTEQGAVGREPASVEPVVFGSGHAQPLRYANSSFADPPSTPTYPANPSRSLTATVHDAGAYATPHSIYRDSGPGTARASPPENGAAPPLGFVAGLLLDRRTSAPSGMMEPRHHADGWSVTCRRRLRDIPTVHLPDTALGALVDDTIGRSRRPIGIETVGAGGACSQRGVDELSIAAGYRAPREPPRSRRSCGAM